MQFDGATVKEQGVVFAIVVVKPHVLSNSLEIEEAHRSFSTYFPGYPLVLMSQESNRNKFHGRKDIVNFLTRIDISRIPWKRYTI